MIFPKPHTSGGILQQHARRCPDSRCRSQLRDRLWRAIVFGTKAAAGADFVSDGSPLLPQPSPSVSGNPGPRWEIVGATPGLAPGASDGLQHASEQAKGGAGHPAYERRPPARPRGLVLEKHGHGGPFPQPTRRRRRRQRARGNLGFPRLVLVGKGHGGPFPQPTRSSRRSPCRHRRPCAGDRDRCKRPLGSLRPPACAAPASQPA